MSVLLKCALGVQAFQAVELHVDWEVVKCLVLAGPGFTKDQFKTYLDAEAVRENVRLVHQGFALRFLELHPPKLYPREEVLFRQVWRRVDEQVTVHLGTFVCVCSCRQFTE